ncbi:hypothetical protein [Streptomyces sp. 061-3]|uniref:hypothetical protein n=1 Tax=Streptomyces sp. 061-3 TaxID=2789268 RepID=UPI0039814C2E
MSGADPIRRRGHGAAGTEAKPRPASSFVGYENPPGVTTDQCVQDLLGSERAGWYNHVNLTAHHAGEHFIPWEIPDGWAADLRRTFRSRR